MSVETAGFYKVGENGYLSQALNRLATPSGMFFVAEYQGEALPDNWQYFESVEAAEAALGATMPPSDPVTT